MLVTKQHKKDPIPKPTANREELAKFWDTHSAADYWDQLKPVNVRFAKNLSAGITIRFDPATLAKIRGLAHEKGLGPTTLARMWILENLKKEEQRARA